jgi:hypothetical protein
MVLKSNKPPVIRPFAKDGAECCEYIGPEGIYWSAANNLYRSESLDGPLHKIAQIDRSLPRMLLGRFRLGRRLAREMFYNVRPMSDGSIFYSFGKEIGLIRSGRPLRITGRQRSSRILRQGLATLPDGSLIFGEYLDNAQRGAVNLYRVRLGASEVDIAYSFPAGNIRHVHSVSWDPFTEHIMVATGDIGAECRLVSFDKNVDNPQIVGMGSEEWRLISPVYTESAIYFGTDAEYITNGIFRYDRNNGSLVRIADVNGPVFYSFVFGGGIIFGTTAELCESQESPEALVYYLDLDSEKTTVLARYGKDRLSTRLFQFGTFRFPSFEGDQAILPFSGIALSGLEGSFAALVHD